MTTNEQKPCCLKCLAKDPIDMICINPACPCHIQQEAKCKNCGGKGYNTVMAHLVGGCDFSGDKGFDDGAKIHKIPCTHCIKEKIVKTCTGMNCPCRTGGECTAGNGIDFSKDNIYDAIGRPDLKTSEQQPRDLGKEFEVFMKNYSTILGGIDSSMIPYLKAFILGVAAKEYERGKNEILELSKEISKDSITGSLDEIYKALLNNKKD